MIEPNEILAPPNDELNLHDMIRVVLSHAKFIAIVTGICLGLALAYAFLWPPTYEAVTTVKVPDNSLSPSGMLKQLSPFSGSGDPIETYVEVCKSENVAQRVASLLNLPSKSEYSGMTNREFMKKFLEGSVKVVNVSKSNLLSIRVQSRDPQLAADLANTWAKCFIEVNLDLSHRGAESKREFLEDQVKQVKQRLDDPQLRLNDESKADELIFAQLLQGLQQAKLEEKINDAGIVVVDAAVRPEKPVSPKKRLTLLMALLLGLFGGLQSAFLLERLRDRVTGEEVLKRVTGLPNYAVVPDFHEDYPEGLAPPDPAERFSPKTLILNPVFNHAYYKESFKILRTNLTLAQAGQPPRAVAVLSAAPEEGKTLVNSNLAIALAQGGKRTLLVDADLRKSSVRKIFGMNNGRQTGLALALTGQGNWKEMVQPSGTENLDLFPNTITPPNPAELLGSDAMRKLIEEFKKEYDFVVFDGAPVLPVTDSVVLSTFLDGVVLLVRWDKTRFHEVAMALEHLKSVKAPVLGTLLNCVKVKKGLYGYGGIGNYAYNYAPNKKEESKK
ncbi:MAG TPA: polysaccharide biosynthesis tyrosine autokinase [bacterium]